MAPVERRERQQFGIERARERGGIADVGGPQVAVAGRGHAGIADVGQQIELLALLAGAVALFFTSESGRQLVAFGRDSVRETKKVVWPSRKEAMQMTGYVFAFVAVMALFLWITDKTLEWVLYDLILGWKR